MLSGRRATNRQISKVHPLTYRSTLGVPGRNTMTCPSARTQCLKHNKAVLLQVSFSSQDDKTGLGKAHTRSVPSLRNPPPPPSLLPTSAIKTVPVQEWESTNRSRAGKVKGRPSIFLHSSVLRAFSALTLWAVLADRGCPVSHNICSTKL